jgi:site-specific DNA-methyltransferase (cytosine-N4-specific)
VKLPENNGLIIRIKQNYHPCLNNGKSLSKENMKSDIPNSSQFSPVQTPLPKLLEIIKQNEPDRQAASLAIVHEFFPERTTEWDWKLADNTILALSEYRLINKPRSDQTNYTLTDIGRRLCSLAEQNNNDELYGEFAKHILVNLRGLDLLSCIEDLVASGKTPTKQLIVKELSQRNIYHPPNGTHANGMRQWLEKGGVFEEGGWVINHVRLNQLLGVDSEEIELLSTLTPEQRAFAIAFARLNVAEEQSNKVAQYATALFGTEFPEGGLPQSVLFALRDIGLIECEKTTGGRGAKPYIVRPTSRLRNELIEPILNAIEGSIGLQYRRLIRMQYREILTKLRSHSTHEKGLALEALAFYFGRLLDLQFVQWRLRSVKTGGAELDVVMEGDRLVFSRWQIQCKNSSQATLEDIAKEVGVAQVIKGNVILIICTGKIGSAARKFAKQVMKETNLYVALIDGRNLSQLLSSPAQIVNIMNGQASEAMLIKREQVQITF